VSTPQAAAVIAWHDAVNRGDADAAVALASSDVVVGGPKGASRGSASLHDWATGAGIHLEPLRFFQRGDTIVAEQCARWRSATDGALSEPQTVASVFTVGDGRLTLIMRYPDLTSALAAAGLTVADEVGPCAR
jgi:ketosteroid isomerase-like protein